MAFTCRVLAVIGLLLVLWNFNAEAKVLRYNFEVKYFQDSPDGIYKDKVLKINGQFPGPTIEAEVGDRIDIQLINSLQDGQNTSIHWHGIHQSGTCFEDGAGQITQCPLRNGKMQLYRFYVHQAGTFWYHSHVNSQYTEGLWGALIVHNTREVYDYDDELLITINDWYHQSAQENEEWHLSPGSRGVPPYPNSGMINGHGRYPCNYAWLQDRFCEQDKQVRSVVQVKPGKKYRVRVINTSAVAAFNFSIDGHLLRTIEADGVDVAQPVPAEVAAIAAGQRYSFLIQTDKSVDRYLIRADLRKENLMLIEGWNINKYPQSLMGDVTAVLEYNSEMNSSLPVFSTEPHTYLHTVPPANRTSDTIYLDEDKLTPYDGIMAPDHFDQEFLLYINFKEDHENIRRGSFNSSPFVLPTGKPLAVSLMEGEPIPQSSFPLYISYMNTIQIILNNHMLGPHPFHLHGHNFWILGTGKYHDGNYDPVIHNLTLSGAKRDTVFVEEESWAVIRFIADNPGLWTFHCHIDWHNLSGMALTFVEAPELFRERGGGALPDEVNNVCGYSQNNNSSNLSYNQLG